MNGPYEGQVVKVDGVRHYYVGGQWVPEPRTTIRTVSGIWIDPFDAHPKQIVIGDIAHALSHVCRFAGHTAHYYSVARHSIKVGLALEPHRDDRLSLAGLLHDASEAYLCDIPRPLKHRPEMAAYREAEARLQQVIYEAFGLPWPMPQAVHEADERQLRQELETGRYEWESRPASDKDAFLFHFSQWRQAI